MTSNSKNQCNVCEIHIEDAHYTVGYNKEVYQFCSERCRELFTAHPVLFSHHSTLKSGKITKKRKLHLSEPLDKPKASKINNRLRELVGVKEWHIDGSTLTVRYDLLQSNLGQLEAVLFHEGIKFDPRWWQRVKHAWLLNIEETELENLTAPAGACCNRPPTGA